MLCIKCKEDKLAIDFSICRSRKIGYSSYCKLCKANYDKQYREQKGYKEKEKLRNRDRRLNDWRTRFHNAKANASQRGLEFSIEFEDVPIPDVCPLLNIPLVLNSNERWNKPSIDRIDSSKGYIAGNVWVISVLANTMKSHASKEQLKLFAENVLKIFI